jgi:nitrogen regulatory protein PII
MELKKITAIIRGDQLEDVEKRLQRPGTPGISVDHVKGYGEYANFFATDWMSRYARIEIVAEARQVRRIVDAITEVVHTGTGSDGVVYVVPVEQIYRIGDQHTVRSAQSKCPRCRASVRLRRRTQTPKTASRQVREKRS